MDRPFGPGYSGPVPPDIRENAMRHLRTATALFAVAALAVPAAAQFEEVENPEFAAWAKFPKGAAVTLRRPVAGNPDFQGKFFVVTLVEVGTDKLTLETVEGSTFRRVDVNGNTTRRDVPRKTTLPFNVKKEEFATGAHLAGPYLDPRTSATLPGRSEAETVKVPAGEFKATKHTWTSLFKKDLVETAVWLSDEVPGRVVKAQTTTKPSQGAPVVSTVELEKIKKP